MTDAPVLVREARDGVLVLRLNRPEARNALNPPLIAAIGEGLADAEEDPGIRCVVLTGTGDRAFCAGMDLRGFSEGGAMTESSRGTEVYGRFVRGDVAVPVVGAAQATAVAGGFELLLGCDLVVAADSASFGLPEVQRGLFPAGGGVYLGARIPLAVALELTLTGDRIDAERAYQLGLVNRVVPAGEVVDAAVELAQRIARNGPLAVRVIKELVRSAANDVETTRAREAELLPTVFDSNDAREGATAFIERRDPIWTGT